MDITEDYKYPEGSALELITVKRAMHLSNNKIVSDTPEDLKYDLKTDSHIQVGKDITLRLNIRNTAVKNRKVKVMIGGNVLTYNGVSLDHLPIRKAEVEVKQQTGL